MAYNEKEARELIVKAGRDLLADHLVARTWGNLSARVSATEFVITPSGRGYEDLRPEDLVKVKIEDCSYDKKEGKPSSEKGIHADVYKLHPEADFVAHTHQIYASAASCFIRSAEWTVVPYGLPGTKTLRRNVCNELKKEIADGKKNQNVFVMERHGALAFAPSYPEVLKALNELEHNCKLSVEGMMAPADEKLDAIPFLDDYAQIMGNHNKVKTDEDEQTLRLIKEKNAIAARYCRGFGLKDFPPMNKFDVWLQHTVYVYKYSRLK